MFRAIVLPFFARVVPGLSLLHVLHVQGDLLFAFSARYMYCLGHVLHGQGGYIFARVACELDGAPPSQVWRIGPYLRIASTNIERILGVASPAARSASFRTDHHVGSAAL
jgi:hypothetical protein